MKLTAREFRAYHALMLPDLFNEKGYREHPAFEEWARTKEKSGPALTFFLGEKVVACAGVSLLWPGVGEAWLMLSAEGAKQIRAIIQLARPLVDRWMSSCHLVRLQCTVRADQYPSIRFAGWLGFELEGRLRAYGPGAVDHYMYAKVGKHVQS